MTSSVASQHPVELNMTKASSVQVSDAEQVAMIARQG
jgi:hypothetical protein